MKKSGGQAFTAMFAMAGVSCGEEWSPNRNSKNRRHYQYPVQKDRAQVQDCIFY
jgi:hypothetical protein